MTHDLLLSQESMRYPLVDFVRTGDS